jgi:hypothetical protein
MVLSLSSTLILTLLAVFILAEVSGGMAEFDPGPALTLMILAIGGAIYGIQWSALVGFGQEDWRPGTLAVYLLAAGAAGLVALVILVVVALR